MTMKHTPGPEDFRSALDDAYEQWKKAERVRNAAPQMLEALEKIRAIITEGALVGFQPLEGDWAERLFLSQQESAKAVEAAGGDVHRKSAAISAASPTNGEMK